MALERSVSSGSAHGPAPVPAATKTRLGRSQSHSHTHSAVSPGGAAPPFLAQPPSFRDAALQALGSFAGYHNPGRQCQHAEADLMGLGQKAATTRRDHELAEVTDVGSSEAASFIHNLERLVDKYKPDVATITLKYKDLNVETDALVGSAAIPTVGDRFKFLVGGLIGKKPPTSRQRILCGIDGVIEPARLTLLLGPPGSGKSAFLKVLAGRYNSSNRLRVSGDITYNGKRADQFCLNRTSAFINQVDVHVAELTVLDTLKFAYECQNGDQETDFNLFLELRKAIAKHRQNTPANGLLSAVERSESDLEEQILSMGEELYHSDAKVENMMRAFGILNAQHTPVGSAFSRGVSGGERKRVTLAEMMLGPRRLLFMDEISTGLDSATLFSIMTLLRDYVHTFKLTCLVSLLQPPPEVYGLFDDLCLMSQGQVVYHGPIPGAMDFFTSLGFVCPPRKDVPSFLQEITTPSGQREFAGLELLQSNGLAAGVTGGDSFVVPVEDMVQHYWSSDVGVAMKAKLVEPFDASKSHPAALATAKYALKPFQAFQVVLRLQLRIVAHSMPVHVVRLMRTTILALLLGGLFFQAETSPLGARVIIGGLLLSVLVASAGSMLQMPFSYGPMPVWYKWRDSHFYSAWVHVPAVALAHMPVSFLDSLVWTIITYFMWGLYPGAGQFFTHLLIIFLASLFLNAMFRLTAFVHTDMLMTASYGTLYWTTTILMSGFAIVRDQIPPWWLWLYYLSPLSWTIRALAINEFTSPDWQAPSPTTSGNTLGEDALGLFSLFSEESWLWGAVAYLLGGMVVLDVMTILAAQHNSPAVVSYLVDDKEVAAAREKAARKHIATLQATPTSAQPFDQLTKSATWICNPVGENAGHEAQSIPEPVVKVQIMEEAGNSMLGSMAFTPVTLVFQDLRYSVPNPAFKKGSTSHGDAPVAPERLDLLQGITGFAEPGVLIALMGGTGAGKTTLMNCISGRASIGVLDGQLTVNGHPKDQRTWSRVVGYCEQTDMHTPAQTVLEAMRFSASLRLPQSMTRAQKYVFVEDVMDMLELTRIQFSLVGQAGRGLSVEQRKRLTIGVELVANPSVVFMDEPTSGLDARSASIVIQAVKRVSRSGRTTMVTVHQPSIEIFETFDQLLLLQHGGRMSYFGPLGAQSQHLVEYLQRVPGCPPLAAGQNPATFMLEVTGGAVAVVSKTVDVNWPELYQLSDLAHTNKERAAKLVNQLSVAAPLFVEGDKYAVPVHQQFKILAVKYFSAYWRDPAYNFHRLMVTLLSALLYGTIWYRAAVLPSVAEPKHVQTMMGIISTCATVLGNVSFMTIIPLLGAEREVFYRERASSTYSPWAFSLTVTTVESPWLMAQVLLFTGIVYPLVGFQRSAGHFLWYLLLSWQSLSYYASLGMMLAFTTSNVVLASVLGGTFCFLFSIFDGFVLPPDLMPVALRWINRVVPSSWALQGLAGNQLLTIDTPIDFPFETSVKTVSQFVEYLYGYQYTLHLFTPIILFAFIASARLGAVLGLRYLSFLRQ